MAATLSGMSSEPYPLDSVLICTPVIVPKGSPAVLTPDQSFEPGIDHWVESAVWSVRRCGASSRSLIGTLVRYLADSTTLEIRPQWINPDGTKPTTYLVWMGGFYQFAITGDPEAVMAYDSLYRNSPVVRLGFQTALLASRANITVCPFAI